MSRFKFIAALLAILGGLAFTETANAQIKTASKGIKKAKAIKSKTGVSFSLHSIYEPIKASSDGATSSEEAMFFGGTLAAEKFFFNRGRWVVGGDAGLMFGSATVGDTESRYYKKQLGYTGFLIGARVLYRWTTFFDTGVRAGISQLNLTLPNVGTATAQLVAAKPSLNAALEFRFHLVPSLDLVQNLGLDVNSSRFFWNIGCTRFF